MLAMQIAVPVADPAVGCAPRDQFPVLREEVVAERFDGRKIVEVDSVADKLFDVFQIIAPLLCHCIEVGSRAGGIQLFGMGMKGK